MKRIRLLGLLSLIMVLSCETELDIIGKYKNFTVVYGVIDIRDSVHEIKVTKAFLGNADANEMAAIPDSSYYDYDEIEVWLLSFENGEATDSLKLDTAYTTQKADGAFYSDKQRYYKNSTSFFFPDNSQALIKVRNLKSGEETYSRIDVLKKFGISKPQLNSYNNYTFIINQNNVSHIMCNHVENAKTYYARFLFNYLEIKNNDTSENTLTWDIGYVEYNGGSEVGIPYTPYEFYRHCLLDMELDANIVRYVGTKESAYKPLLLEVTAVDKNYYTYTQLGSENDEAYTEKPDYTNIENGIGLFCSRVTSRLRGDFAPASYTELYEGEEIRYLNFRPRVNW